jgi:leader peptidase (prepilin peptidase)/N-methyltransferase
VHVIASPLFAAGLAGAMALSLGQATIRAAHHNLAVAEPGRWRLVSAATAAMAGVVAVALVSSRSAMGLLVGVPLLVFALPATVVDAHEQRLPDSLTCPLAISTTSIVVLGSLVDPTPGLRAASAAAAVITGAVLLKMISTDVVGWGDVKFVPSLAAVVGWSGWGAVVDAIALWVVFIAAQSALASMVGPRGPVPYGPAFLAGVVGALVVG